MGLVGFAVAEVGADRLRRFVYEIVRHKHPPAELRIAWIFEREIGPDRRNAIPHRKHTELRGQVLDDNLCPQFVNAETVGEGLCERQRNVEHESAAMGCGRFRHQKVRDDLALRRQQRAEPAKSGPKQVHIRGHKAIQEFAGVLAAHLDDAAIRQKCCFHGVSLGFSRDFSKFFGEIRPSHTTWKRKALKCGQQGPHNQSPAVMDTQNQPSIGRVLKFGPDI